MTTRQLVRTALFAALTAVGAFLKIPLGPSAITLQFFFTAMAGCLLGSGCGALSQLIYVALGLLGLPVFTAGGGFSYVLHPTFGFLLGLIPAAWVIGRLARSTRSFWHIALAALAGVITSFSHLTWVQHAFAGIRVCVCVLIFNAVLKLWKSAVKDVWGLLIFLAVLAASLLTSLSPVWYVLAAGVAGVLIQNLKGAKK